MKKAIVALTLIFTLLLQGCSLFSLEGSDIMCPPKATGAKAQIQELIEDQTSSNYTLIYPKNGSIRSAIVTQDIDFDDEEEAIAFYTDDKDEDVHVLFLKCKDDEYSVVDEIVCDASGIDRIEFADINHDNIQEVLIGYTSMTSSQSSLYIYSYGNNIKAYKPSYPYSSFVTGDFNSDNRDDILLISLYSGDIAASSKLMVYDSKLKLKELGTCELDSDITQLANITYGKLSYDTYGVVIDGVSSTGDYTTQIVLYDKSSKTLLNPLFSYTGYTKTRRSTQVLSTDINSDEIIDIPLCSLMGHSPDEDTETVSRQIDWSVMNIETFALETTLSTIVCSADGYAITIPEKWINAVTARYDKSKRETTIYVYEYVKEKLEITDTLLTIKAFDGDIFSINNSGYTELATAGTTVYAYTLGNADNYLAITGDQVEALFTLVNQ